MSIDISSNIALDPPLHLAVCRFGEEAAALSASSQGVVAALREILAPTLVEIPSRMPATRGVARSAPDAWNIEIDDHVVHSLAISTPAPKIAEELISAVSAVVARKSDRTLIAGPLLTRDGATISLSGEDLDFAKILAFHLLARGWSLISLGFAFLSRSSLDVSGLDALSSISSSSIDQIPPRYRAAVEKSRWYDAGTDLIFYTVDPSGVPRQRRSGYTLTHVVIVNGDIDAVPILETEIGASELGPIAKHHLVGSLQFAKLTVGTPIASCDTIEQWVAGSLHDRMERTNES